MQDLVASHINLSPADIEFVCMTDYMSESIHNFLVEGFPTRTPTKRAAIPRVIALW